jgi:hypothetical protein
MSHMHNKHVRIAFRRPLPKSIRGTLVSPSKSTVEITDVSRAGFFLRCARLSRSDRALKSGSVVELRFSMPGSTTLCEVTAEVRHKSKAGIGVRAVRMSETARVALERVVAEEPPRN